MHSVNGHPEDLLIILSQGQTRLCFDLFLLNIYFNDLKCLLDYLHSSVLIGGGGKKKEEISVASFLWSHHLNVTEKQGGIGSDPQ